MTIQNKQIRVLLVDDEIALSRSLARVLTDYDFEVETTTCAAEASAFLKHVAFDVIVCDQNMPGKSGLELLTELKTQHPDLIRMMLSGQVSGFSMAEDWAREIGVTEVFAKPCDANIIAARIEEAVAEQQAETQCTALPNATEQSNLY